MLHKNSFNAFKHHKPKTKHLVDFLFFIFSFPGTESALNELRNFGQYFLLNNIKAAEPPDAAPLSTITQLYCGG
jgi:hypothetical protein